MIKGVTLDFCYMMRSVCTHFSIYAKNVSLVEIQIWGGEKHIPLGFR